ncbi:GNAT family N-acetyltransferase [Ascidiaceihabitans sp.]|uniref:GNAT family N-acetyltransferase n=1 Tax=Ascidiaceihabitans sp. TaxID=1872644 RepID=UPI00329732C6
MQHTLTSERLILRPFVPQDADAIVAALNDAETCRGLTVVPYPYTKQDADQFISEGTAQASAVCLKDGQLIGCIGLGAQLGYWFAKPHWGKGYATEAALAVLADHFAHSDTDVMSGYVDDNFASAAVLRKLGFVVVGNTMLHIRSRGIAVPAKSVCLTRTHWEALS